MLPLVQDLKIKAAGSPETPGHFYQTTCRHIPENNIRQINEHFWVY
jgi:hypothetical protein